MNVEKVEKILGEAKLADDKLESFLEKGNKLKD
jgi:hypothetical protein